MDEFETIKSDYDIIIQDNDEELTKKRENILTYIKDKRNFPNGIFSLSCSLDKPNMKILSDTTDETNKITTR